MNKYIKIAGLNYKIKETNSFLYDRDGIEVDGLTNIDKQTIKLSFCKGVGKDYKRLILLHELTHLLFYYAGTGNKLWKNEKDVNNFSVLLHQVLKDNKI